MGLKPMKTLATAHSKADFRRMTAVSFKITQQPANAATQKKAERPRIFAAAGLLDDAEITVSRENGESDAQYQERCAFVGLLVESAREG